MEINAKKTKLMTNTDETFQIIVNDDELKQVNCFVYLSSKLIQNAECTDNMKTKLAVDSNNDQVDKRHGKATHDCKVWPLTHSEPRLIIVSHILLSSGSVTYMYVLCSLGCNTMNDPAITIGLALNVLKKKRDLSKPLKISVL